MDDVERRVLSLLCANQMVMMSALKSLTKNTEVTEELGKQLRSSETILNEIRILLEESGS